MRKCSVDGCDQPLRAKGMCKRHWWRMRTRGSTELLGLPIYGSAEERFWARVIKTDYCWGWIGGKSSHGYGEICENGKSILAHTFSYRLHKGEVPAGLEIDHLCRNRNCVNPDHLEAVTKKENILRGNCPQAINARKTHCNHGHPYSGENLIIRRSTGWRYCRLCQREWAKSQRQRRQNANR